MAFESNIDGDWYGPATTDPPEPPPAPPSVNKPIAPLVDEIVLEEAAPELADEEIAEIEKGEEKPSRGTHDTSSDYTNHWCGHFQAEGGNVEEEAERLGVFFQVLEDMRDGTISLADADAPTVSKAIKNWAYGEFTRNVRKSPENNRVEHRAFLSSLLQAAIENFGNGSLPNYAANELASEKILEIVATRFANKQMEGITRNA